MTESTDQSRKSGNDRVLLIASLISFVYFSGIILVDFLKLDWVIISIFREMLTIPFLIALLVLFILSSISLFKTKRKTRSLPFYSLLILLVTILLLSLATFRVFLTFQ